MIAACGDSGTPTIADSGSNDHYLSDQETNDLLILQDAQQIDLQADQAQVDQNICTPNPFIAQGSPTGFIKATSKYFVTVQGDANHRGQDVVVKEGEQQVLIGKFAYGPFDTDLTEEEVEIYIQPNPPCGEWKLLATEKTSNGEWGRVYGIDDDGGRIFYEISANDHLTEGVYPVRMLVRGDYSLAAFSLFVVKPNTQAVVFDIDGTLTTKDSELHQELLNGDYVPEAYLNAVDVVNTWASKDYLIVYLTGRPDFLRRISSNWLKDQSMPFGVLHLTDTYSQALPNDSNVGSYKKDFLNLLVGQEIDLVAAYGNSTTDIYAYNEAIDKAKTYTIGTHAGEENTVKIENYADHLNDLATLPFATGKTPISAWDWPELK